VYGRWDVLKYVLESDGGLRGRVWEFGQKAMWCGYPDTAQRMMEWLHGVQTTQQEGQRSKNEDLVQEALSCVGMPGCEQSNARSEAACRIAGCGMGVLLPSSLRLLLDPDDMRDAAGAAAAAGDAAGLEYLLRMCESALDIRDTMGWKVAVEHGDYVVMGVVETLLWGKPDAELACMIPDIYVQRGIGLHVSLATWEWFMGWRDWSDETWRAVWMQRAEDVTAALSYQQMIEGLYVDGRPGYTGLKSEANRLEACELHKRILARLSGQV
jgi:hypothetical protein